MIVIPSANMIVILSANMIVILGANMIVIPSEVEGSARSPVMTYHTMVYASTASLRSNRTGTTNASRPSCLTITACALPADSVT